MYAISVKACDFDFCPPHVYAISLLACDYGPGNLDTDNCSSSRRLAFFHPDGDLDGDPDNQDEPCPN